MTKILKDCKVRCKHCKTIFKIYDEENRVFETSKIMNINIPCAKCSNNMNLYYSYIGYKCYKAYERNKLKKERLAKRKLKRCNGYSFEDYYRYQASDEYYEKEYAGVNRYSTDYWTLSDMDDIDIDNLNSFNYELIV